MQQAWVDSLVPGDDRPERLEALLRAIDESMPNLPMLYPQIPIAATDKVNGLVYYQSGHIEFAGVTMSPVIDGGAGPLPRSPIALPHWHARSDETSWRTTMVTKR